MQESTARLPSDADVCKFQSSYEKTSPLPIICQGCVEKYKPENVKSGSITSRRIMSARRTHAHQDMQATADDMPGISGKEMVKGCDGWPARMMMDLRTQVHANARTPLPMIGQRERRGDEGEMS